MPCSRAGRCRPIPTLCAGYCSICPLYFPDEWHAYPTFLLYPWLYPEDNCRRHIPYVVRFLRFTMRTGAEHRMNADWLRLSCSGLFRRPGLSCWPGRQAGVRVIQAGSSSMHDVYGTAVLAALIGTGPTDSGPARQSVYCGNGFQLPVSHAVCLACCRGKQADMAAMDAGFCFSRCGQDAE
jgi:hypothetical protein